MLSETISKTAVLPDMASFAGKMCAMITPPLAQLLTFGHDTVLRAV